MEWVGKCVDDLTKAHLCPRRQQNIYLNRGTTFQSKMNPRDLKYTDSKKERAQNAEKWRLTESVLVMLLYLIVCTSYMHRPRPHWSG